ncbi:hypothetical protein GQR58_022329 [Nymphon striatum]|nr:hypothetical protein GQR58_022329 [Nymphon striatum]
MMQKCVSPRVSTEGDSGPCDHSQQIWCQSNKWFMSYKEVQLASLCPLILILPPGGSLQPKWPRPYGLRLKTATRILTFLESHYPHTVTQKNIAVADLGRTEILAFEKPNLSWSYTHFGIQTHNICSP